MTFARPEYLNWLWAIAFLGVFFFWSFRRRQKRLEKFVSAALVPKLTREFSRTKSVLRALFLLGFFAFAVLSLARPQWGARLETVRRHGVDVIAALDTSYSMNTEDATPSRLAKAKNEIRGLIRRLRGDRIGLVSFAGTAMVQCPLTLDYGAAGLFLDLANTEVIPEPGTSLAAAIRTATSAFVAKERKFKVLVIFTDGEDLEGQVDVALAKATEAGVIIYTVGIGTPEGRPIPVRDDKGNIVEYRKDSKGQVVISSLDERSLSRIATGTGGAYFRSTAFESELDELYDDISKLEKKELESQLFQNFEDQFQYPLGLAIVFLAAECWMSEKRKRRRTTFASKAVGLTLVLLTTVSNLQSASIASKNKQGNKLFEQGSYPEAEKAYVEAQREASDRAELHYNLGNTFVKQKKYDQALQSLRQATSKGNKVLQASSWFNEGTALYEMGKFDDSAQAFVQALRINPTDRDAKHNLELALRKREQDRQNQQDPHKGQDSNQPQTGDSNANSQRDKAKQSPSENQERNSGKEEARDRPPAPGSTASEPQDGSLTKLRSLQILDALQNQETSDRRKLLDRPPRHKATGRDW